MGPSYRLYTRPGCKYCNMAKKLLAEHGHGFDEQVVGHDITRGALLDEYPAAMTLPVVVYNGRFIGGYEELEERLSAEKNLEWAA